MARVCRIVAERVARLGKAMLALVVGGRVEGDDASAAFEGGVHGGDEILVAERLVLKDDGMPVMLQVIAQPTGEVPVRTRA